MSTSVHEAPESWPLDDWVVDAPDRAPVIGGGHVETSVPLEETIRQAKPAKPSRAASASIGLSGGALVLASALGAAMVAVLDLWLTNGRLTFFFDLCFVVLCLVAATSVRRTDLFTAGVLPPLIFAAAIAVVSVVAPQALGAGTGVDRVFLTGLATHAAGLVAGYAVALLTVAARTATARV